MEVAVFPSGTSRPHLVPRGGVVPICVDGGEPVEINLGDDLDGLDDVPGRSAQRPALVVGRRLGWVVAAVLG